MTPEEQALERLHTSTDGMQLPNPDDPRPWLNSTETVDGIVRQFGAEAIRRFNPNADEKGRADFAKWADSEALRLNGLFLGFNGTDPAREAGCAYQRMLWNTPEQLGKWLHIHYVPGNGTEDRFAAKEAFHRFGSELVKTVVDHMGEPAESWGWQMDAGIEEISCALLGLPFDNGDEDRAPENETN